MPDQDAIHAFLYSTVYAILRRLHKDKWPPEQAEVFFAKDNFYRVRLTVEPGRPGDGVSFPPAIPLIDPINAKTPSKPASVNQKMLEIIEQDWSASAWPASKWAEMLGCRISSVCKTRAWKRILDLRTAERASRAKKQEKKRAKEED